MKVIFRSVRLETETVVYSTPTQGFVGAPVSLALKLRCPGGYTNRKSELRPV